MPPTISFRHKAPKAARCTNLLAAVLKYTVPMWLCLFLFFIYLYIYILFFFQLALSMCRNIFKPCHLTLIHVLIWWIPQILIWFPWSALLLPHTQAAVIHLLMLLSISNISLISLSLFLSWAFVPQAEREQDVSKRILSVSWAHMYVNTNIYICSG